MTDQDQSDGWRVVDNNFVNANKLLWFQQKIANTAIKSEGKLEVLKASTSYFGTDCVHSLGSTDRRHSCCGCNDYCLDDYLRERSQ